jgi:hypothetical protein
VNESVFIFCGMNGGEKEINEEGAEEIPQIFLSIVTLNECKCASEEIK